MYLIIILQSIEDLRHEHFILLRNIYHRYAHPLVVKNSYYSYRIAKVFAFIYIAMVIDTLVATASQQRYVAHGHAS